MDPSGFSTRTQAPIFGQQRARLLAGEKQSVERLLSEQPHLAHDQSLVIDLIYHEFCLRADLGQNPSADEFLRRFPALHRELEALFQIHVAAEGNKPLLAEAETIPRWADAERNEGDGDKKGVDAIRGDAILPRKLGRYLLTEKLGSGGMATVFKAYDDLLDISVAIKFPLRLFENREDDSTLFLKEARALARLHHPNLCRIYDAGEIEGQPYLSMAFVEGRQLAFSSEWSSRQIADVIRTIALALDVAHQDGVVHRDLKPGNILLTSRGVPIVVDFGLAIQDAERKALSGSMLELIGTIPFMSPEQVSCSPEAMGASTDIYSLGVVLYTLLTDKLPFSGPSGVAILAQISDPCRTPTPPARIRSEVDPRLSAICLRALEKDRSHRYPTMRDLADDLEQYLATQTEIVATVIEADRIVTDFAPVSKVAPQEFSQQDHLFLDVGNRIGPGVIDHRASNGAFGSTTSCTISHAVEIRQAIKTWRKADAPFGLILPEEPDLDTVAAAFLSRELLEGQAFSPSASQLAAYVDSINAGNPGISLEHRYSMYVAYQQLMHRLASRNWDKRDDLWRKLVSQGLEIVSFVLRSATQRQCEIEEVDAFATPGLFGPLDRREVDADIERYQHKLLEASTGARRTRLALPAADGKLREVDVLFAANVSDPLDPDRCIFFKDWARTDQARCPASDGFAGLCLFENERGELPRRCTISVRPNLGISLAGLGQLLEEHEAQCRSERCGVDDRTIDPQTGQFRPLRPGFNNADPWYDGRSHTFTIVAAPANGTVLTRDEIEEIVLRFAGSEVTQMQRCIE